MTMAQRRIVRARAFATDVGPAFGDPATRATRPAVVRGWAAVAGAFLVTMVGFGAIYSYAAFAEAIADDFGSSRASVSLVYALSGCSCFFVSAVTGPLADRLGARVPAAVGMLLVGLGLATAAVARSLIEVFAGYGILVGLGCGFAYVPALAAVQRSFDVHRGLASGVALSGIGIGTALVPPATAAFAAFGDWRSTFLACGALAVLVGLCGAALLPTASRDERGASAAAPRSASPAAVQGGAFALAYAGTLLVSLTVALPHAALVGTARDLGVGQQSALALLGLIGVGAIIGRFVLAAVADVAGRRKVFLLCCGGTAASMLFWAAAESEPALQAFALGFGALQGGLVALLPAFVADTFGAHALGRRLGVLYTSRGLALLAGPPALAFSVAGLAGHQLPLVIATLLGLTGVALLAAVRPPPTPRSAH